MAIEITLESILITIIVIVIIVLSIYFLVGLRVIYEWEEGIVFTLGKYTSKRKSGLRWIAVGLQILLRVDIRIRTVDVHPQELITKDSCTVAVDAIIYYKVFDSVKALLRVENFTNASVLLAQSVLRDVLCKSTLDEILAKKKELGDQIIENIQISTDEWGVNIVSVEINNIEVPENMKRAMAKEAEAIREKRARQLKAEAEVEAAKNFVEASTLIQTSPIALRLRELQTWQEIGAEQNSLMILIPSGLETQATTIANSIGPNMLREQQNNTTLIQKQNEQK